MPKLIPILLLLMGLVVSCADKPRDHTTSSMFHSEDEEGDTLAPSPADSAYDLPAMRENGAIVVGLLSGPSTYYELRGEEHGIMYHLARNFASSIDIPLRIVVAADTTRLLSKLASEEIDILAIPMSPHNPDYTMAGCILADSLHRGHATGWLVRSRCPRLIEALSSWYVPIMYSDLQRKEADFQREGYRQRDEKPQYENPDKQIISPYDSLFRVYAPTAGVDWTFLAAVAWQESGFDPRAESYTGAQGLMQLMPATASSHGLKGDDVWDVEKNLRVSAQLIHELQGIYRKVENPLDRLRFVLAAYNCGSGHVNDAMQLTEASGGDRLSWGVVSSYLGKLSQPEYFTLPSVRLGYVNGPRVINYVTSIMSRWEGYMSSPETHTLNTVPKPAKIHLRDNKYHNNNLYTPKEMR